MIRVDKPGPLPISRLDLMPDDLGFAGGTLGTADNATTGAFMGQTFITEEIRATPETAEAEMQRLLDSGIRFIVTLADADTTVRLADMGGLVFNAADRSDRLRGADCRANVLHPAPSDAMLTDALDGIIARKFNQITALGKLLDPLADKLSLVTLLGLFVSDGQIPLWVLAIILVKEVTMVIGGGVALKRGVVVYALPIGKVTTVVFVLSIIARFLALTQIADTLLWISVALSMVALIWYAVDLMKKLGIKADSTK